MNYPITILSDKNPFILPTKIDGHVPSGKSEYSFCKKLENHFGSEKIEFGREVKFKKYIKYKPDIIYWDKINNIIIDIEVDEPYNKSKKNQPII